MSKLDLATEAFNPVNVTLYDMRFGDKNVGIVIGYQTTNKCGGQNSNLNLYLMLAWFPAKGSQVPAFTSSGTMFSTTELTCYAIRDEGEISPIDFQQEINTLRIHQNKIASEVSGMMKGLMFEYSPDKIKTLEFVDLVNNYREGGDERNTPKWITASSEQIHLLLEQLRLSVPITRPMRSFSS